MELDEFLDTIRRLKQPSLCLSKADKALTFKLAYAFRVFQRRRLRELVDCAPYDPAMLVVMADGWGSFISNTVKEAIPGSHLTITRNGKLRHEFILQRGLAVFQRESVSERVMLFEAPIGMGKGRKTGHNYQATCDFLPLLREVGHKGLVLHLYLVDGCLFRSLEKYFHARRCIYYDPDYAVLEGDLLIAKVSDFAIVFK